MLLEVVSEISSKYGVDISEVKKEIGLDVESDIKDVVGSSIRDKFKVWSRYFRSKKRDRIRCRKRYQRCCWK